MYLIRESLAEIAGLVKSVMLSSFEKIGSSLEEKPK